MKRIFSLSLTIIVRMNLSTNDNCCPPQGLAAFGGTMICFIIPRRDDGTCMYLLVSKSARRLMPPADTWNV